MGPPETMVPGTGAPVRYLLRPETEAPDGAMVRAALAAGLLPPSQARDIAARLLAGETVLVMVPQVEDRDAFERDLALAGIAAQPCFQA